MNLPANNPWLSLLIPAYNVEHYLPACLNSLAGQLVAGVEVLVLDDCSTDATYHWLQGYAQTASFPIKVLQHSKNLGLSGARNTLLAAATGDYLWFIDSDDLVQQGAIARLHQIVTDQNPDLVLCDHQVWRSQASECPAPVTRKHKHYRVSFSGPNGVLETDAEALFSGLYAKGKLHAWSKIAKRSLWRDGLCFPEGQYFEDMVTTPRLALNAQSYVYCAEPWLIYRQRPASILANFNQQKLDHMVMGLAGVLAAWTQQHPHLSLRARYFFVRYSLKIAAFVRAELKKMGINNPALEASYLNKVCSYMGMSRTQAALCLVARGDLVRLGKLFSLWRRAGRRPNPVIQASIDHD